MRRIVWRQAARTDVSGNSATFTFGDNILPVSRPGDSLVAVGFRFRGATTDVADFDRVRLRTQSETFYDQTVLHERLWQERFCYSKQGPTTVSGATSTTVIGAGGYVIWLNDQRAMTRDLQDQMAAPLGAAITAELVTAATGPAAATTVDMFGIYSSVTPTQKCRRTETVINIANGVTGGVRQIDEQGAILAYGIPYPSITLADSVLRWRMRLRDVEIFDGDLGVAIATEIDEANTMFADSITDAGTGVVIWKDTRGYALPGGPGSYVTVDTGANSAASLATVEMPIWSTLPQ